MKTCIHSRTFDREPLDEFLASLSAKNYSSKSIKSYGNALDRLIEYLVIQGVFRIQDVTLNHLESYRLNLIDRGLSNATQYLYLRCTRFFFGYLEETHQVFINPALNLVIPKYKRKLQQVPSVDDINRLLDQPDIKTPTGIRDKAFLETMYSCGLRREEGVYVNLHDPDLKQGLLKVNGKGDKERMLPIGDIAKHWIEKYLIEARPQLLKNPEEKALWLSERGLRLSYSTVDKLVTRYALSAGITSQFSTHSLRRAGATHMLNNGAHPFDIQMLLGHSELKSLSQYLKVTIKDMKDMHERSKPGQ